MNTRLLWFCTLTVGTALVAGCGGSGSKAASAAGDATTTTTNKAGGDQTAFRDCLRKNGVDLPEGFGARGGSGGAPPSIPDGGPPGGGAPGGGAPGGPPGAGPPGGAGGEKFQAAMKACASLAPAGGFLGGGGGRGGANGQAIQAYLSCLSDHGVKVPTPAVGSGASGGSGATGGSGAPGFGDRGALGAVRSDPNFAAASKTCQPLLPTVGRTTTTTTPS